jgi:hypothetical protein
MVKKAVSSGSALEVRQVHKLFGTLLRRGPRNDIQIVQRIAWTNVYDNVVAPQGADVYE